MSYKIHANYHFIKWIQKTCRCSSHRGINLCLLYSILISDRLNLKVVGANFNAMQNVQ